MAEVVQHQETDMHSNPNRRAGERIPVDHRMRASVLGGTKLLAILVNLSLSGALLQAASPLPVGSSCEMAILNGLKGEVRLKGTVVRSDASGTAIQFSELLAPASLQAIVQSSSSLLHRPLIQAYLDYFRVSHHLDHEGSQTLLGVSKATFQRVFLTTFTLSIILAIWPVWAMRNSIPAIPDWAKIGLSFVYGGLWLGLIQPTIDLAAFRFLRSRN